MSWFGGTKEMVDRDYNEIVRNVLKDGTVQFRRRGDYKLHNIDDKPAVLFLNNGTRHWYKDGLLHRDFDLPAIQEPNVKECWYKDGLLHRDHDLPAIRRFDGKSCAQLWYQNGICHRENDKPAIIEDDGSQYWYYNGLCHREGDLPSVIKADGYKAWYINGELIKEENNV